MRARPAQLLLTLLALTVTVSAPAHAAKPAAPTAVLGLPASVQVGTPLTATVQVSDPKLEAGRPVQLERLATGTWTAVASTTLPASGVATLTTTAPASAATYSYRATLPATKKSSALVTATAALSATPPPTPPPPVINDVPLPAAVIGQPYSSTFTTADGRAGRWEYVGAARLPAGLTLTSGGSLVGTPTGPAGRAPINLRFFDEYGQTADLLPWLDVLDPSPVLLPIDLPHGTVGSYYEVHLPRSTPYPAQFVLTSGALPAALHLDADGTISNTVADAGTFTFEVTVTDEHAVAPQSSTRSYTLVVDPAP